MRKLLNVLLFLFIIHAAVAQPVEVDYRKPLNTSISLSANFAEMRSNHFHSGVDLKVGGVVGAKLYAVADGYISRINVSPFGYGKAVYINHPNGETSVYGHLDGFNEKIRKYIEAVQYKLQSFRVDETIDDPDVLPVKKGEVIGFAGNSGSSFGAHLHFEIRKTHNQVPTNVVTRDIIRVMDNVPPNIHSMAVFTLDSTFSITTPRLLKSAKVMKKGDVWVPEGNTTFEVYNPVYFGVYANDYQPNNRSKFGINHMTAYIDSVAFFAYTLDEFTFEETRYINSFIAYEELVKNNRSYVKTFVEDGNRLSVYKNVVNNGLIVLNDTLEHTVRMDLFDDSGNKTVLVFKVKKAKELNPHNNNLFDPEKFRPALWNMHFNCENEGIKVYLSEESLYSNMLFTLDSSAVNTGFYTPVWTIGNFATPLHKHMAISLKPDMPEPLKKRAVIVRINANGKASSVGGTWDEEKNFIMANVAEFGSYSVAVDSIPPTIKLAFKKGADMRVHKSLTVTIADNLSGIDTYNGYIDDEWALFDYDAKTRSLTYRFDAARIKKGQRHRLKVVVEDGCKNSATLDAEFIW
ncbi:MAG: M23 family metallopeptidase [Prevotellaceae bacterium]|jgi:murein DD-endopeptidase MepM/ murein hydrolase activator NlpD|nr:M23 family metallopeptidase [Prevotellaceae bacterium]